MDLTHLPRRSLLRWDPAVRVALAIGGPLAVVAAWTGTPAGFLPAVVAVLVTSSSLGPDMGQRRWSAFAAVLTPVAGLGGVLAANSWLPLRLGYVFGLYALLGVFLLAGLVTQLAMAPVAAAGLYATVLAADTQLTWPGVLIVLGGAAWGYLLIPATALIPFPRLPIPAGALTPRTTTLHRMFTRPTLRDWGYPLLLGTLSAVVLLVAGVMTDNASSYWAVTALVSVLAPAAAHTRAVGWQTVLASVAGVLLIFLLADLGWPDAVLVTVSLLLGCLGVLVLLTHGTASKVLTTQLIVILVAVAAGNDPADLAGLRLWHYALGVTVALLAAGAAEFLALRLEENRPAEEATIAA